MQQMQAEFGALHDLVRVMAATAQCILDHLVQWQSLPFSPRRSKGCFTQRLSQRSHQMLVLNGLRHRPRTADDLA